MTPARQATPLVELRRRVVHGDRPRSAAWEVCATMRPASVTELLRVHLAIGARVPPSVLGPVVDAYQEWVEGGRPGPVTPIEEE